MEKNIIISVDVGFTGGITVFNSKKLPIIHRTPVKQVKKSGKKTKKGKNTKNAYDMKILLEILKPYSDKKVIFGVEKQSSRHGEGSVSSFTSGTNFGLLLGIGYGLGFDVKIIQPQTWKKYFPEIISQEAEILRAQKKKILDGAKNIKDYNEKKKYKEDNEKEINKLTRLIKADAKKQARLICQNLYPKLKQEFMKVKDDGVADATLIGIYMLKNLDRI